MRLVKFKNGKYGVRTHWFFGWHFVDFQASGIHWPMRSRWFKDCQTTEEKAREYMGKPLSYEIIE